MKKILHNENSINHFFFTLMFVVLVEPRHLCTICTHPSIHRHKYMRARSPICQLSPQSHLLLTLKNTLYIKIFRPHNNLTLVFFFASTFLLLSIDFFKTFFFWYREQSKQLNDEVKLNDGMATEH